MSVVSVNPRSFILALFIRDDGERFLLGDKGYDFKDSQLHFAANTIENDEVMKQGADGVMVAGQVRRASVQSFDGFVGDATMAKETIEQMRRDFFAFFVKGHHFRVIYVDCNRNAWQRKGGYLVDAPEVKELWQIHPEYHVGLNFEDVNYYSYDEDADGEEILSNLVDVPVSTAASGGLVWDEDGAVSEDAEVEYIGETAVATPVKNVYITDAAEAPLASFQLDGETSQNGTPTPSAPVAVNTTTGENVIQVCGKNLFNKDKATDHFFYNSSGGTTSDQSNNYVNQFIPVSEKITIKAASKTGSPNVRFCEYKEDGTFISRTLINALESTVIVNSNTAKIIVSVDAGPSNYFTNLQIELGSTATAYEPYQGQSYEVNLGKNLCDFNATFPLNINGVTVTKEVDGSVTLNGTLTSSTNITFSQNNIGDLKYLQGQMVTLSFSTSGTGSISNIGLKQSGAAVFEAATSPKTVTVDFGTRTSTTWQAWCISGTVYNNFNLKVQLEKGSTATSYAPYFTPIELCKIGDYQDYIYKSGDKWYVRKECEKVVLDGSETWTGQSMQYLARYQTEVAGVLAPQTSTNIPDAISNYFAVMSPSAIWGLSSGAGFSIVNGTDIIRIANGDTAADVESFKTWLASHPTAIYYALATPTDTEITNEALIAQLEAVLAARTYAGTNNITTITPNEQGTLEISYYTKYQPMVVGGGYVWEAGGSGGATVVVNNSIDNVSPIWKIYGPTTNPQLENSTTGEVIEYVGVIAEGQTLTIDMGEQTASLDGLNVISNLVGDFISLAPGANRLIYSVLGDAGASSIGWSEIVG